MCVFCLFLVDWTAAAALQHVQYSWLSIVSITQHFILHAADEYVR